MSKVYEVERGKPTRGFTLYPSWKCPSCLTWRREPMGKVCRKCKPVPPEAP